jgi:phosphonate transport system permease protein
MPQTDRQRIRQRIDRRTGVKRALLLVGLIALIAGTVQGMRFLGVEWTTLADQFGIWLQTLKDDFFPPNFGDFTAYTKNQPAGDDGPWTGLIDSVLHPGSLIESIVKQEGMVGLSVVTLIIGATGTVLGFPLALLLGVLGSERVVPFPLNFVFRLIMSTIRAVPALVWVLVYVPLAGISPVSAMLAVATDTIGNLGRLFTDELEEIAEGPTEAIRSTGAGRLQVVSFGMLSQVASSFIAWTLYILEINVRIAISLGVLGAGGIGQYINLRIDLLEYDQAMAGIIMVIGIVIGVEMISSRIRARLRPGEMERKTLRQAVRDLGRVNRWLGLGVITGKR